MRKIAILMVAVLTATISFGQKASISFYSSASGSIGSQRLDTTETVINISVTGVVIYNEARESIYDLDFDGEFNVQTGKYVDRINLCDNTGSYEMLIYHSPNVGISRILLIDKKTNGDKTVTGTVFIK